MARIAIPSPAEAIQLNVAAAKLIANGDGDRLQRRFNNQTPLIMFLDETNLGPAIKLIVKATGARKQMPMPNTLPQDFLRMDPNEFSLYLRLEKYNEREKRQLFNRRIEISRAVSVVLTEPLETEIRWRVLRERQTFSLEELD